VMRARSRAILLEDNAASGWLVFARVGPHAREFIFVGSLLSLERTGDCALAGAVGGLPRTPRVVGGEVRVLCRVLRITPCCVGGFVWSTLRRGRAHFANAALFTV
jgi:hypothetical protein